MNGRTSQKAGAATATMNPRQRKMVERAVRNARQMIPAIVKARAEQLLCDRPRVRKVSPTKPLIVSIHSGGEELGSFEIPAAAIPQLNRVLKSNPRAKVTEIVEDCIRSGIHPGVEGGFYHPNNEPVDADGEVEKVWPLAHVFRG